MDYRQVKASHPGRGRQAGVSYKYDHVMSSSEASRLQQDRFASIDKDMNEAIEKINWERRNAAEDDIVTWVNTYCIGVFLDEAPPPIGEEILREMFRAVVDPTSRPYLISMSRGGGKTSYMECVVMYAISSGKKKFPVLISQNATSAQNLLNDIFRIVLDGGTAFAQDYPELCLPFQITNGSYRRRQTYNGVATEIVKNSDKLCFARLKKNDGTEFKTSGSAIYTKGITSGIRGIKRHTLRPDLALLDDLQTTETAESQDQVEKLLSIIQKDVFNLSGKGKISILQTGTPICSDDLIERLKQDKNWKVTVWPAIIDWPKDILEKPDDGYWAQYFKLYDAENIADGNHVKSLKFYTRHRKKMDTGAKVMNPNRYLESDGHISALQALLEKKHVIGDSAFYSEYMMQPVRVSIEVNIHPKNIISMVNQEYPKHQVPDGYVWTCLTMDLNTSYGITATVTTYKTDSTSLVLYHHVHRLSIDQALNEVEYNKAVYQALSTVSKSISDRGMKIDAAGIDCGGRNWNVVCEFCKHSTQICGIPACAMAGRNSTNFNPLARSRLRNAVERVVLCGDEKEHVKSGTGNKWLYFDSDYYREHTQRAFLGELGSPGCCMLYNDLQVNHIEFANQVCNEKLMWKKTKSTGVVEYHWKSKEPHDFLDTMAMSRALASHQGLTATNVIHTTITQQRKNVIRKVPRKRIRVV